MSNFNNYRAALNETHCKYDYKDFRESKDIVVSQSSSWLLNKNSPFKDVINSNLMWMHATGLGTYGKYYVEEKQGFFAPRNMEMSCEKVASTLDLAKSTCNKSYGDKIHIPIGLKHLSKLFLFYLSGNALAGLTFMYETFAAKTKINHLIWRNNIL